MEFDNESITAADCYQRCIQLAFYSVLIPK